MKNPKIHPGLLVVDRIMATSHSLEVAVHRVTKIVKDPKWHSGCRVTLVRPIGSLRGSVAQHSFADFWHGYRLLNKDELKRLALNSEAAIPPALKKFRDALAKDYKAAKEHFVTLGFNSDKNELIRDVKVRLLKPLLTSLDKAIASVWPQLEEKPSKRKRRR